MPPSADASTTRHHDWRVEQREIDRQVARRGREHAFVKLAAERTALVVVDLVPFFVDANPYCRGILKTVACAASAVREAGGTVAWVVPGDEDPSPVRTEFYGADTAAMFTAAGGTGTPVERVWPGLDVGARTTWPSKRPARAGSCPADALSTSCSRLARSTRF